MKPTIYETSDFSIRCVRYNREIDFLDNTKIMRRDIYDIFYADDTVNDIELILKISGAPDKFKDAIAYYLKNREPNTISITAEPGYIMGSGLMMVVDAKAIAKRESDILEDFGFAKVFWGKNMSNTAGCAFVYGADAYSKEILGGWWGDIAKEIKFNVNKSELTTPKTTQKRQTRNKSKESN